MSTIYELDDVVLTFIRVSDGTGIYPRFADMMHLVATVDAEKRVGRLDKALQRLRRRGLIRVERQHWRLVERPGVTSAHLDDNGTFP